jgi:hypothetical protein
MRATVLVLDGYRLAAAAEPATAWARHRIGGREIHVVVEAILDLTELAGVETVDGAVGILHVAQDVSVGVRTDLSHPNVGSVSSVEHTCMERVSYVQCGIKDVLNAVGTFIDPLAGRVANGVWRNEVSEADAPPEPRIVTARQIGRNRRQPEGLRAARRSQRYAAYF